VLSCLALLLAFSTPLFADEVDDQIDAAKVYSRAGKNDSAIGVMNGLLVKHADDPRVHYYRFVFLKKLSRLGDAADALERAQSTVEACRKADAKAEAVAAVANSIADEATDFLSFRRSAQKSALAYKDKALEAAGGLLSSGQEKFALYLADDVFQGVPSQEDEILAIWLRVTPESRAAYDQRRTKIRIERDKETTPNFPLVEQNLAAAERSLTAKDFKEAKLSALAALEVAPGDPNSLTVLSDALAGLGQNEDAALATLQALDAPYRRGDAKTIKKVYERALKQLHALEPKLEDYVRLRSDTAKELVRLKEKAANSKRAYDAEWIDRAVVRLAPGDPAVQDAAGKLRVEQEAKRRMPFLTKAPSAKPAPKPEPVAGFTELPATADRWQWRNKPADSGVADNALRLTPHERKLMVEAVPKNAPVAKKFTLRFKCRFEIGSTQEPWIFMIFEADAKSGNVSNAVILFPEGDHVTAFASRRANNDGWSLKSRHALPREKLVAAEWCAVEVYWNDETKRLKISLDGESVADAELAPTDTLHGTWSFGFAGAGTEIRIKDVLLKNEP
jgi:tetratricopeptide (TPR) repeat protein